MDDNRITIGLAGDVMIGRNVNEVITSKGYSYPWGDILSLLTSTDINIINLETTLTNSISKIHKTFNFKAAPDKVSTLAKARITAVNLANNHIMDFDEEGLTETIRTLQDARIKYAGAGMDEQQAAKPVIITCRDTRIGMLGFTDNEPGWRAGVSSCGINYINVLNSRSKEKALNSIQQLRSEADLIIVSIHWGPNMKEKPDPGFVEFAHEMIDNGADLIHGHSAHIFQGIEVYKNKLILYDTGDFLDDYVVDPVLRNDHSFFFIAEINKKKFSRLHLVPVLISKCQVNLASLKDSRWSLQRMQQLSAAFGTKVTDAGYIIPGNEINGQTKFLHAKK
ncbi:MAG: CapA family protein [Bacteroidota bacterium]|nr:CapA family protein [Bacteroidota bacterium]